MASCLTFAVQIKNQPGVGQDGILSHLAEEKIACNVVSY